MDEASEVAVSLDELSFDIALDASDQRTDDDFLNIRSQAGEDNETGTDDQFTNLNAIGLDSITTGLENEPPDFDDEEKIAITEGDIDIEMVKNIETDSLIEQHNEIIARLSETTEKTAIVVNTETVSDVDDFEVDEHPLSLFPRRKECDDEDEDSEFEFPEIKEENNRKKDLSIEKESSKSVQFTEQAQQITYEDTQLNSKRQENLEPEILTPRDKVTSDITTVLNEVKILTQQEEIHDSMGEGIRRTEKESQNDHEKDHDQSKPSVVTTAEDWDQVQVVVPGFADEKKSNSGATPLIESKPLTKFSESWSEMASMNYDDVKDQIKTRTDRRGISALTHFLFGPPKLHKSLHSERDLIFSMATTKFDNDNQVHTRILQTVYRCLTGSKFNCRRFGSHWEEIGFQGQDPATDLRGGGVLSLLHLLYFLQDRSTKELARDVYKLSLHPTQNFPFCVMSINISVMCLRVVREDVYNREFNKRKDVAGTMNSLYAALFLNLYQLWKKGKTIHDSGYVLEEVANYSRKNSKNIFKDLETYEKNRKEQNIFGDHPSDNAVFLNVCKQEKCDQKITAELY